MIRAFNGKTPRIADSAFVSEWAYVVGDVEIGENSGVWPGAVIRGDYGTIKIGKSSQVEDITPQFPDMRKLARMNCFKGPLQFL